MLTCQSFIKMIINISFIERVYIIRVKLNLIQKLSIVCCRLAHPDEFWYTFIKNHLSMELNTAFPSSTHRVSAATFKDILK